MILTDTVKNKGLLLDTNLLVLLAIGSLNEEQIHTNKRTKGYTVEDHRLLLRIISNFDQLVVTPNILTEASNLLSGASYRGINALSILEGIAGKSKEEYINSLSVMKEYQKSYTNFGLADAVIHAMAKDNYTVLTQDSRLCAYLEGLGLSTLNFGRLRLNNLFR